MIDLENVVILGLLLRDNKTIGIIVLGTISLYSTFRLKPLYYLI